MAEQALDTTAPGGARTAAGIRGMPLARQLTLAMLLAVLLAFSGRALMTVFEMRDYLDRQLQSHARDSARSLGLSISLHLAEDDEIFTESIVDAMFDSGDYARIEVLDAQGYSQLIRKRPATAPGAVPSWFVDWVPLRLPMASAELTRGWKRSGTVLVQSHPGYAYQQLWDSARISLWSAAAFLFAALGFFSLLLNILLRPLRVIERQAKAVANRQFPSISRLPGTRELRRVAEAMNYMTGRVQNIIEEQAEQARRLSEEVYIDSLTGVRNRRASRMDIAQLVREGADESSAALLMINVNGLDTINRQRGYEAGDRLVREAAAVIIRVFEGQRATIGRYGGALFAVTLADVTREAPETLVRQALAAMHELPIEEPGRVSANAGIAFRGAVETVDVLIARCEAALRSAQQNGAGHWQVWKDAQTPEVEALYDEGQWAEKLQNLVAQRNILLEAQPVQHPDGSILHYELLARFRDSQGQLIPAAKFIPMAAHLGMSASLDIVIVEQVLEHLATRFQSRECFAVNLSPGAAADLDFQRWLKQRLSLEPRERRERLAFEVTEHFATCMRPQLQALIDCLHPLGVRIGIDHCGSSDVSMTALRDLPVDYAKLYGALIQGLDEDRDKYNLVRSLVSIGHGLGLTMVAEFIESAEELDSARSAGFDALQGYFIGRPEALD